MNAVDDELVKREIKCVVEELERVENRKDIPGMLDLLADDFIFVHAEGLVEGKQAMEVLLNKAVQNYLSSKHVPLRIEVSSSGDMAWLFGYELNNRQGAEGVVETKQSYLLTFRKVAGKWKQAAVCLA